jgi:hypothetical protein
MRFPLALWRATACSEIHDVQARIALKEAIMKGLYALVRSVPLWIAALGAGGAAAQSSVFTYQGQLLSAGMPVNGSVDFNCSLWDAPTDGAQIGVTLNLPGITVTEGLFTLPLDFGDASFTGGQRWLELSVDGTPLAPRQELTATPYALHAARPWRTNGLQADAIPGGISWAGWTTAEASDPTAAVLIHHPLGMRKSYSWGDLLGIELISQCLGTASDTYDFELIDGGQDGGSSGAPVFDVANRHIRAVATCSESDDCIPDEDTGEGSFAHAYDALAVYLNAPSDVWVAPVTPPCQDGTQACPWDSLLEGYYGVQGGGTVHVLTGSYPATNFNGTRALTLVAEGGLVTIGN